MEAALRLGADGLKCMFYPWSQEQPDSQAILAALAADCCQWGLPLMAEVIPGGFAAGAEMRTPDKIAAGARVAIEAGADVIKTFYTGDAESFRQVLDYCPAPVMVLGGERATNDEGLLDGVRAALAAGAAGWRSAATSGSTRSQPGSLPSCRKWCTLTEPRTSSDSTALEVLLHQIISRLCYSCFDTRTPYMPVTPRARMT